MEPEKKVSKQKAIKIAEKHKVAVSVRQRRRLAALFLIAPTVAYMITVMTFACLSSTGWEYTGRVRFVTLVPIL